MDALMRGECPAFVNVRYVIAVAQERQAGERLPGLLQSVGTLHPMVG